MIDKDYNTLNKPILDNEYINLKNLFHFMLKVFTKYSKLFLVGIFFFTVYFLFIQKPIYSSQVSFYTNYSESKTLSSFSFISSFAEAPSEDLGFSISDYVVSDKILKSLVNKEYDIDNTKKTLVEYWGKNYKKIISINPITTIKRMNIMSRLGKDISVEERKMLFAKESLRNSIAYSEDRKSSLHTISVLASNPKLSRDITNQIFQSILSYSNEVTNVKAKEKKDFIQARLFEINQDLEKSENDRRLFLEKNQNIGSSPSLILQKERLERNIVLYSELYLSLSDQLEIAKIDEKDNTSSIFLLDSPHTSPYKPTKGFFESIFIVLIILFMICVLFEVFKNRNQLFI